MNLVKDYIFDQVVIFIVIYDRNENQFLLSYGAMKFETEDSWVWLRNQQEQDFPEYYVLIAGNFDQNEKSVISISRFTSHNSLSFFVK